MDKLARELLLKRKWADIINIFTLTKNRPGVVGAKFAWITGRAVQEGLLSTQEMERVKTALGSGALGSGALGSAALGSAALNIAASEPYIAEAYFRIAYNSVSLLDGKSLYYRSLSAAALGKRAVPASLMRCNSFLVFSGTIWRNLRSVI